MKNTIERIQDSIDDIKTAINAKYLDNEAPIGDDTLLEEYALAIDNIKIETIDVSQQIFVFYCWATNETDARSKILPTITWNSNVNKWSIECSLGGWSTSADEEELDPTIQTDAEKYLYAMFVSVNTDTNSSNIAWPDPVRLTGKTGAKGEDGSDGRDGVIAGLTLRNIIPLYCFSDDIPTIQQNSATYTQPTNDLSKLFPKHIKINDVPVDDLLALPSDPGKWRQSYNNTNNTNNLKLWTINVLYSSNNTAAVLGNPVLVADSINIETKYSTSPESGADWQETPLVPSVDNQIVYKRTTITSDSGVEHSTIDTLQYPKSIVNVTYKYGTSNSTATAPDKWDYTYPINTSDVVWIQRIETFSEGDPQLIQYPIGLRGPAGIQFIASVESENALSSIPLDYDNDYIGKLGVRVGQDVYVWYGTENPNLTGSENIGSNWWLNIGPLSPIPDWNAKKGEAGYIENRTHYVQILTETKELYGGHISIPGNTKGFVASITVNGQSYTTDYIDVESGRTGTYSFSGWDSTYIYVDFESRSVKPMGDNVDMSIYVTFDIWDYHKLDPKFVSQMIEITYADLKNLRDTNQLIPGMQYRITDYTTTTIQANTQSAGHQFDIIVTADDVNVLNEKARAIQHKGDTYFSNSDLNVWELKYCIDNDIMRFEWANITNGKGVIYYMKDEWNNECPYDFKNIQFKNSKDNLFYYTFTRLVTDDNTNVPTSINDASVYKSDYSFAYSNYIGTNTNRNGQSLPLTIITGAWKNNNSNHQTIHDIYIGPNSYNNYFFGSIYINSGGFKYWNHHSVENITMGFGCKDNTFNEVGENSAIGNNCENITCTYFRNAKIGNNCKNCELSGLEACDYDHLHIGNNCEKIICPDYSIMIGDDCLEIDFTHGKASNVVIKDRCTNIKVDGYATRISDIIFEENCSDITLKGDYGTTFNNLIFEENCKNMTFYLNANSIAFKNSVITNRGAGKTLSENTENKIFEATTLTRVS